ncbi:MAG: hypothetical protein ABIT83_18235 [Massilia sp.]
MASKNLVVMPFGRKSLRSPWLTDTVERDFDVVLLCYHDMPGDPHVGHTGLTAFQLNDFKWWMIADLFERAAPDLLTRYDNFYFIDDDIETDKQAINFLFDCFERAPVRLAQPALTRDSFMSWKALRAQPLSGHRYVSSVELMCPLMKRDALQALLPIFKVTKSGWGVDLLWGQQMLDKFGPDQISVFDVVKVRHGRPVGKGELYDKLDTTAKAEEDFVRSTYGLAEFKIRQTGSLKNAFPARFMSWLVYQQRKFQQRRFQPRGLEPRYSEPV